MRFLDHVDSSQIFIVTGTGKVLPHEVGDCLFAAAFEAPCMYVLMSALWCFFCVCFDLDIFAQISMQNQCQTRKGSFSMNLKE